jgi:hypothetical protein
MAIYLFKIIRKKLREREAQKAIPTADDSHLVPEYNPGQELEPIQSHYNHGHSEPSSTAASHIDLTPEEAAQRKAQARQNKIRQWKLMLGLALPNFLAAVDVTIVAPAMPLISSHFSKSVFSQYLYNNLY